MSAAVQIETTVASFPDTSLSLYAVNGGPSKKAILESVSAIAGVDYGKPSAARRPSFPGPNPVSIDRGDIAKLTAQPYMMSEKTDGVRAALAVHDIGGVHLGSLFDRTVTTPYVFSVKHMPRTLYQGSLFDGELVFDRIENAWVYLIFDAFQVAGVPVFHLPFTQRLTAVQRSLQVYSHDPEYDTACIRVKQFLPFHRECLAPYRTHEALMKQRYAVDGLILMPEHDHVVYGRHDNLLKLKQIHSVDFVFRNGKLHIFDETTRRHRIHGTPSVESKHIGRDGDIVECILESLHTPTVWTIVKVRTDKKNANNKLTLNKTILNMQENLSLDVLLDELFAEKNIV